MTLNGSKLRWKTASSSIGRNITYVQDGGLQVNVAGLYHIYSRLVFVDDGKDTADRTVSYSIWLRSSGKEDEKLLDSVSSECKMTSSVNGVIPSFQSASFELEAGDIVEVRVSDVAHLHNFGDKNDNYFGLYYVR
ncbi:CD40 ligand-like [Gigantopelta aegis]|uniref:CD40 ligand-like n=1 Tax=Gigantopelta aegis TaxID=1735272 RepID=UPI001B88E351|nr:CD40 ligand-like [Gigantopelta aegis]